MKRGLFIGILLSLFLVSGINGCPEYKGQVPNSVMLEGYGGQEVVAEEVNYFENAKGYLARPSAEGEYPGVIMIHEWWGLNDNIKDTARQLASNGYTVLAVDLYNGQVAEDSGRARELSGEVRANPGKAVENMMAAADYLRENHNADKMASLGWCFGGGQSLQLALSGEDLDATVIYYGSLTSNETELSKLNWPVLGVFGEEDTSIPVSSVKEFGSALDKIGVANEIYIYPGVGHAFANPTGMNYAAEETKDAWEKTLAFLNKSLK